MTAAGTVVQTQLKMKENLTGRGNATTAVGLHEQSVKSAYI